MKHLSPLAVAEANSNKTKTSGVRTFVPGAPVGSKSTNDESPEVAKPPQQKHPTNNQPREFPQATLHAGVKRVMLSGGSNQDLLAIQDAIKKAKTMDEVERLHQMLSSGQFAGFAAHWHKQQKH